MAFEWYEDDDTTPAGTAYTLTTSAGTASAAIELHAWLNKGSSVGTAETRFLRVYVEDPSSSGTYKTSGLDCLDRREFEVRIVGSQNPDLVGGFVVSTTGWIAIGTNRGFQLPPIYPNCCIEIEVRINPTTDGGSSSPATFYIKAVQGSTVGAVSIPTDVTVDGDLDFDGNEIQNVVLNGFSGTMNNELSAGGYAIASLARSSAKGYAASTDVVYGRPMKRTAYLCSTVDIVWPDVAVNGTFATDLTPWAGTGWSHSADTALHTVGSTDPLTESLTIVSGVTYRITVTVTGAAGTVTPSIGAVNGTPIAAGAGTVTQRIVAAASGTLALAFTPTTDFDGALDDVICETMFYGLADVDSVTAPPGKRMLLAGQDIATENGPWYASATAWTRTIDCDDTYNTYAGIQVYVQEGDNGRSMWVQTADIVTFATDAQVWEQAWVLP